MNQYETVFILTPVLSDVQMKEAVEKFKGVLQAEGAEIINEENWGCLLYTSDAADEEDSGDLGGPRIIKKKKKDKVNADRHVNKRLTRQTNMQTTKPSIVTTCF